MSFASVKNRELTGRFTAVNHMQPTFNYALATGFVRLEWKQIRFNRFLHRTRDPVISGSRKISGSARVDGII
jgi:hypothetical protein